MVSEGSLLSADHNTLARHAGHKSFMRSTEGLRMYEAASTRKTIGQQIKALKNRLARLSRDKTAVEKAIESTSLKSEGILKNRKRLETEREQKKLQREAEGHDIERKLEKAKRQREFHRSAMSTVIADLRSRNCTLADHERRESVERMMKLDLMLKEERNKKKERYLKMSATQQNLRALQHKHYADIETKLSRDYSNRILGEQTTTHHLKQQLSELERVERELLDQLSQTQLLRSREANKLQVLEANRNVNSRAQLTSVVEDEHPTQL